MSAAVALSGKDWSIEERRISVGPAGCRLELPLRRVRSTRTPRNAPAVLLVHGANSSGETFLLPDGGLSAYLARAGWDAWVLEWRGSPHVMVPLLEGPPLGGSASAERAAFSYDTVAREDIPAALDAVRAEIGWDTPLSLFGHCVGGGIVTMAVGARTVERFDLARVTASALGLFYRVPWDGRLRVEDLILERLLARDPDLRGLSPLRPEVWPAELTAAFEQWPAAWLPRASDTPDWFRRLCFMVGRPWAPGRLHPRIDATTLRAAFGPLHLGLFLHSGQLVRRGHAVPFERDGDEDAPVHYLDPEPFRRTGVTLVTGAQNGVWHRDSIDRMYDWLRSAGAGKGHDHHRKRVFQSYGLQDLFWGPAAEVETYPALEAGLR